MFGKFKNMLDQVKMAQQMMQDENFKKFISHPKVQEIFRDEEFKKILQSNDPIKMMNHPKIKWLQDDPELAELLKKVDFQSLFKNS